MTQQIVPTNLVPVGRAQVTDMDPAVGVTVPAGAKFAYLQAETADIRWTDDGVTTPTATVGMLLIAGQAPLSYPGDLSKLNFFETATSSVLHVHFYGYQGAAK